MFYKPVLGNRLFRPQKLYSQIDWTNLQTIVTEFDKRIRKWYLNPARRLQRASGNYAFPVMALACMLTDALSQFYTGKNRSARSTFINFVTQQFPTFNRTLPTPINRPSGSNPSLISNFAEALYYGFRCGILHEAHVTPYGVISGQKRVVKFKAAGLTHYWNGADCPTIVIDPKRFLDTVESFLVAYVNKLRNPKRTYDPLRTAFKTKFSSSFGIDITSST